MKRALRIEGLFFFALFIGTVFGANWLIKNLGLIHTPSAWLIPVWPGILAPSGVIAVGLGFTLRDLVQRRLGIGWSVLGIALGALATVALDPRLAFASGSAFLISELLDLSVYTPLQRRNLTIAVIGSNVVGLVVDSAVFLTLAFGSLQFLPGQIIGKLWFTLLAIPVIHGIRVYDRKRGVSHYA